LGNRDGGVHLHCPRIHHCGDEQVGQSQEKQRKKMQKKSSIIFALLFDGKSLL
jgi:hypothetical protein